MIKVRPGKSASAFSQCRERFRAICLYRVVREPTADRPGVKLMGVQISSNVPLTRVLWSMSFPDDHARDRLFAWLAHRLDRWVEWGELAADKNAQGFSEHLLQLAFADRLFELE